MQALTLDGSREGDAAAPAVRRVPVDELERVGWQAGTLELHSMQIGPCMGCFDYWVRIRACA